MIGPLGDGRGAVTRMLKNGTDIAVVDIKVRNGDAYEVADELLRREIPSGVVTGHPPDLMPPAC